MKAKLYEMTIGIYKSYVIAKSVRAAKEQAASQKIGALKADKVCDIEVSVERDVYENDLFSFVAPTEFVSKVCSADMANDIYEALTA